MSQEPSPGNRKPRRLGCLGILGVVTALAVVAAMLTAWWIKHNIYAGMFNPTTLNQKEERVLAAKLDRLERSGPEEGKFAPAKPADASEGKVLAPEPYPEEGSAREIRITEKELNALIARNEETARRVALDLSDDLVSVRLLIPLDKGLPFLGGKTLRLNCGITLSYAEGKPVVAIRGVSVGGIPLPGAWWGNIKNTNLVQEFAGQGGFWDIFSQGVEDIAVRDGYFFIKLKE